MNFIDMMKAQDDYNQKVLGSHLTNEQKRNISKDLALNSYNSVNTMIQKMRTSNNVPNEDDLIYSSIDVFRYVMSILNLWNVDHNSVESAFLDKDIFLEINHQISKKNWKGESVIIVDIDDVIVNFRSLFAEFLKETYNLDADVESEQYYFVKEISDKNLNPEKVFENFVNNRNFRKLQLVKGAKEFLCEMKNRGYWIQLLTSRPEENLKIFYDTYYWLHKNQIPFDRINFSPEKFRWCMNSEYYDAGAIRYAIDDSPKHVAEYAKHGICVKVPLMSYNKNIKSENISFYKSFDDLLQEENNANQ